MTTTYSLNDIRARQGEVFEQALSEPVIVTKDAQPTHVIVSARSYWDLVDRLRRLEDLAWGTAAAEAEGTTAPIGPEAFTREMERLSHAED